MKKSILLTTFLLAAVLIFILSGCQQVFNKPPVWKDIPDQVVGKGQELVLDLKSYVSDPDNNLKSISLVTTGKGSIENGVYKWTPTEEGEFSIKVAAEDMMGEKVEKEFKVKVNPSGTLVVYAAQFNSGPAVEGATVVVKDKDGNVRGQAKTDASGKASVITMLTGESEELNIFISKESHARTTILGLKLKKDSTYELTTTLRKATMAQTTTEIPIDVDVELYTDATMATPIDPASVTGNTIFVVVTATPTEFKEGINIIYAKANGVPGTSFFTNPRLYASGANVLTGSISVREFEGEIPLIVDVYDHNDNKVEKIVWLNVVRTPATGIVPYLVERYTTYYTTQYDLYAYTRNGAVEFYSKPPVEKNKVKSIGDFEPAASPNDKTNLWIEVRWLRKVYSSQKTTATTPKAYKIYRSFDGENFKPIATVPESYYYYRDASPELEIGKKTWYAVSAVYDGYEATKTVIGYITPLPMLQIEYIGPLDGATNVSRDPEFGWRFKGLEAYTPSDEETPTTSLLYRWDIWLYDETLNDFGYYSLGKAPSSYYMFATPETEVRFKFSDFYYGNVKDQVNGPYWLDFGAGAPYAYDKLQANKTYEWGNELLAAQWAYNGTALTDPEKKFKAIAYSVHTDNNAKIVSIAVETEIYHTFTTGSN